ncbi:MAG: Ig domain-containing protein, partial [Alphaproteobacteria bacterium]|nr:Ig domain-containing protein [Alphaproteobacteria bacterium]
MKKQYFFIWMMAATMFAASCSKDGSDEKVDTQTPAEVSQDVQTKKTHPITIVAEKKSSSVSKVSLANDNSTLVFDREDVLVLMNGEDKCGELVLKNGAGESSATFEGTINEGVTSFTAQIGSELQSVATSNVSLKALVDANTFLKSGEVSYTAGETISLSLTDQNAYFAIATNLDNTTIKFGTGENATEQSISANGIWIAVPDGTSVTLFGKTVTAAKGQFYSVAKDNLLTSITLSDETANVSVGGTTTLSVSEVSPTTASNAVVWSSSNTEVASVDENGVVTGIAAGEATITATATDGSGVNAECIVTVKSTYMTSLLQNGAKVYFYWGSDQQSVVDISNQGVASKNSDGFGNNGGCSVDSEISGNILTLTLEEYTEYMDPEEEDVPLWTFDGTMTITFDLYANTYTVVKHNSAADASNYQFSEIKII